MHIITRKRLNDFAALHPGTNVQYLRTVIMTRASGRNNLMALDMMVRQAEAGWSSVQKVLYVPHTADEYNHLVQVLDQLIDQVGEDETHPLASLMEVIGVLIERYEDEHVAEITEL